jgi:hypothetical protein
MAYICRSGFETTNRYTANFCTYVKYECLYVVVHYILVYADIPEYVWIFRENCVDGMPRMYAYRDVSHTQ